MACMHANTHTHTHNTHLVLHIWMAVVSANQLPHNPLMSVVGSKVGGTPSILHWRQQPPPSRTIQSIPHWDINDMKIDTIIYPRNMGLLNSNDDTDNLKDANRRANHIPCHTTVHLQLQELVLVLVLVLVSTKYSCAISI